MGRGCVCYIPVYEVQLVDSSGLVRKLHRNYLLPLSHLPIDCNPLPVAAPQKKQTQVSSHGESECEDLAISDRSSEDLTQVIESASSDVRPTGDLTSEAESVESFADIVVTGTTTKSDKIR